MWRDYSLLVFQLFLLWLINEAGYLLVNVFNLSLPGNVMAMLILVSLLASGIIPLKFVERAANLLIKHLAFFFIPIAVGLMNFGEFFLQHGLILVLGLIISTGIGMFITGFISQYLAKKKEGADCGDTSNSC
ncbi:CidA/LrgA family protein [Thalassobacillus sp. C254]|uniref:CidA/LrgA family protein n=1 Tax=Thalassobacillus sp. C254 TaxID=1225341 RepID=UPI0006D19991|nr:CidA/LrgA family protein [Thalassobacillus sp. C254]